MNRKKRPSHAHGTAVNGDRPLVCVAAPLKDQYSETFIDAHVARLAKLPARVERLYGGYFPTRTGDGGHLLNAFERVAAAVIEKSLRRRATTIRTRALQRHLQRERVAAVLAEYGQTGTCVLAACRRAGVPLVVHFHGSDAFKQRWLESYGKAYPELLQAAAGVIATSREMESQLRTLGAPADRLVYNPCGADTTLFRGGDPGNAPPTFLAVGRFVDKKAPHLTLRAFRAVLRRCPDARLVMAGDGELLPRCRQMVEALGLSHAVELTGPLAQAEVAERMRSARGFVQHSVRTKAGDREGTPVAVLEAGATGIPVVSTRHGGIADVVVHGKTGFLVDEGNVSAMAYYLTMLATDAGVAKKLGAAARRHVRGLYSLERATTTLWEVVEAAIRRKGSPRDSSMPPSSPTAPASTATA